MTDSPLPYPAEAIARLRVELKARISDPDGYSGAVTADLAALLDYAERAEESVRLRPIATAPEDETIIDLFVNGVRYPECWWSGLRWVSYVAGTARKTGERVFEIHGATHWLPLPAPHREGAQRDQRTKAVM